MIRPTGDHNTRLLTKVCYLSRAPGVRKDLMGDDITVQDTFPYNPDSKTAPETAKRWAERSGYDYATNKPLPPDVTTFVEYDNKPFYVTILDLDVRTEGGRAYKVVDDANRCFDLREDQVLEVFQHAGIIAGGRIVAPFVWGILGSQIRLVVMGGALHAKMLEGLKSFEDEKHKRATGQVPTEATFQVAHAYRKRDKSEHVFLGRVKVPGNDKPLFAFFALPSAPHDYANLDLNDHVRYNGFHGDHMRLGRDVAQNWATMTWQERCQWEWYDRTEYLHQQYPTVEPGTYHHPGDIVLMSSPKFEAEVDVGDLTALVQQLRANEGSKHKYVNGNGDDLAEARWIRDHNGGEQRARSGYSYWTSAAQRKAADAAFATAYKQNRRDYNAGVTWL